MPRRSIWSARQRGALFDLPTDEAALLRRYTLSDDDIEQIRVRRGGRNRLGFALQLGAFRYPGRLLAVGEGIPLNVLRFIAAQLGMRADSGLSVRFCPPPESTPFWAMPEDDTSSGTESTGLFRICKSRTTKRSLRELLSTW